MVWQVVAKTGQVIVENVNIKVRQAGGDSASSPDKRCQVTDWTCIPA